MGHDKLVVFMLDEHSKRGLRNKILLLAYGGSHSRLLISSYSNLPSPSWIIWFSEVIMFMNNIKTMEKIQHMQSSSSSRLFIIYKPRPKGVTSRIFFRRTVRSFLNFGKTIWARFGGEISVLLIPRVTHVPHLSLLYMFRADRFWVCAQLMRDVVTK